MRGQILVRRPDGDFEGELAVYDQFDAIPRFANVGSWSVQAPATPLALQLGEPGWGLSYVRNGKTIISGPQTLEELKFDSSTNTIIASGLSDLVSLNDKLVWPSAYPFTADDYDDKGPDFSEALIKYYVEHNITDPLRQVADVAVVAISPNLNRGTLVSEHGRFQNLLEFVRGLALVGGNLGFDILDNVFDVYEPVDRSLEQVFSVESGSVLDVDTKVTAPTATRVICAGGGAGTSRTFVKVEDNDAAERWGRHIEVFIDARDTTDVDVLTTRATEALLKGAEKTSLVVTPIDRPNRTFVDNWYLGDTASDGKGLTGVITEVHLTLDAGGELIKPKLDSANSATAQATLKTFDAIRRLSTRMLNLERSQ